MRGMSLYLAAAALSFIAGPCQAEALNRPANGLPQECQTFLDTTLKDHGWNGGFFDVPQDWSNPKSSPKIKVFYYYNGDRDLETATPILFFNGGPFLSYHNRLDALDKIIKEYDISKSHLFIMMDQRGTGCSVPVMPPALEQIVPETLPLYASNGVARDAESLRQSLFPGRKWKIYGQSYGGELTSRYLNLFPDSILDIQLYAPGYFESMEQFFYLRIKKQNQVLQKFFDYYQDGAHANRLRLAAQKMQGGSGQDYCIDATTLTPKVCGQALLDSVVAVIGQGSGRYLGSTEIWDGIRDALLELGQSGSAASESHHAKFMSVVAANTGFFQFATNILVQVIWAQETRTVKIDEDLDCQAAYRRLNHEGVNIATLPLDECRIIKNLIPPAYKDYLRDHVDVLKGTQQLVQDDTLKMLAQKSIPFYLYTGELDSLVQPESMSSLIASPLVNYTHFQDSGHAGWQWQPLVWKRLMDNP